MWACTHLRFIISFLIRTTNCKCICSVFASTRGWLSFTSHSKVLAKSTMMVQLSTGTRSEMSRQTFLWSSGSSILCGHRILCPNSCTYAVDVMWCRVMCAAGDRDVRRPLQYALLSNNPEFIQWTAKPFPVKVRIRMRVCVCLYVCVWAIAVLILWSQLLGVSPISFPSGRIHRPIREEKGET